MATIFELELRDQPISNITILTDRAEVKRIVKVGVKEGINEVQLKNFPEFVSNDSVRVEGRGNAIICDVVEKKVAALSAETDRAEVTKLRAELKNYEYAKKIQEDQRDILKKKIGGLHKTVGEIGQGVVNPPKDCGGIVKIDDQMIDGLQKLFDFQAEQTAKLSEKLRETVREIERTSEIITKIQDELSTQVHAGYSNISRNVIIALEAAGENDVELDVIYQVSQCGWEPSYDVRVDTMRPSMAITYFGKVFNASGEDWNDFQATLSTAQPSLGGHIPELGTLDATFYRPVDYRRVMHNRSRREMVRSNVRSVKAMADDGEQEGLEMERERAAPVPMAPPPMEVTQNTLSTEFKISRKTTIPNATHDHKVAIGTVILTPTLVHESVPSKNASAFLTASAVNSSVFPFLKGETSIFLDSAFVAKSHMKNVSPGERFTCSLGVDTAIRVEYKPAKKYHEEAGYITKHSANVTEQAISVKNTRSEQPVLLTIKHHVPRSTDEKIRVKLITPVATPHAVADQNVVDPKEGVVYNKNNNLEWTVKVGPNSSKDLLIKWVVEHPKGKYIKYQERF